METKDKIIMLVALIAICFCVWTITNVQAYKNTINNYWGNYLEECECQCLKNPTPFNETMRFNEAIKQLGEKG